MGEPAVREEKSMLAQAKANLNVCIIREDAGGAASALHFREELLGGVDDLAPAEHELPAAAAALAPQHGRATRGDVFVRDVDVCALAAGLFHTVADALQHRRILRQLPFEVQDAHHVFGDLDIFRRARLTDLLDHQFQTGAQTAYTAVHGLGVDGIHFEDAAHAHGDGGRVGPAFVCDVAHQAYGLEHAREGEGLIVNAAMNHVRELLAV